MEIGARSPYPLLHLSSCTGQRCVCRFCTLVTHSQNLWHLSIPSCWERGLIFGWLTKGHMSAVAALPASRYSWNVGWNSAHPNSCGLDFAAELKDVMQQNNELPSNICQRQQARASASSSHSYLWDGSLKFSFKNMGIGDYLLAVSLPARQFSLMQLKMSPECIIRVNWIFKASYRRCTRCGKIHLGSGSPWLKQTKRKKLWVKKIKKKKKKKNLGENFRE